MIEIDRWDVEAWAARSRKGEVCGILGCRDKPVVKCPHCGNHYCQEHAFVIGGPGHQRGFKFDWEGGLSELKEKFTSVELQHKAKEIREAAVLDNGTQIP